MNCLARLNSAWREKASVTVVAVVMIAGCVSDEPEPPEPGEMSDTIFTCYSETAPGWQSQWCYPGSQLTIPGYSCSPGIDPNGLGPLLSQCHYVCPSVVSDCFAFNGCYCP
jgi:hypothetical protein